MIRRLACAWLVLWSVSVLAEEAARPDFSGTWILDKGKSRLQAPAPDASILHIDHSSVRFLLHRAHVVDGKADLYEILVLTDGKEDVKKSEGYKAVDRCRWEGDSLVVESRVTEGREKSLTFMKHSLSPNGNELTVEERFTGPDRKVEHTLVLRREITPPTLDVTEADLAEIKAAVLRRFEAREAGSIGEGWAEEIRKGEMFTTKQGLPPGIGTFDLILDDGRLALVRRPPPEPPLTIHFGYYLAKLDGRWVVLETYIKKIWSRSS